MLTQFKHSCSSKHWLFQFLIAALYVLSGAFTYEYLFSKNIVCIVWLGSGLALAALLLGGWRYLWGVAIGTFVFNFFTIDSHLGSIGVSLASIIEVALAFWLLSEKIVESPNILPNYLKLILLGGGVASVVGSVLGVSTLLQIGIVTPENYLSDILRWWMGDTLGVILITPFALIWWKEKFTGINKKQLLEGIFLVGSYVFVEHIIFLDFFHDVLGDAPKGYVLFFGVTVAAIRLGMRGVTLIMLFTAIVALLSAYLKIGYFSTDLVENELRNCWLYLFILSLSGVSLASYVDKTKRTLALLEVQISERKQIELELQRSNADLEQFAYAASHDMRQPLRMVASYLKLLEESLGKRLDEEQQQFLQFALDGAKRMDGMILSLLEYSRIGRQNTNYEHIASRDCLDEALAFLSPVLRESAGKVDVSGDWIELVANHDELTRLLQNLISNALKYHEENQPPLVQVRAIVGENVFRVEVQDFGIGIESTQMERLFKVFSRLHARTRFEGTGVGLALCRKIVEQHGGTIGVESEGEGFGCTFWFELPYNIT
ncbi:MAG: MASE1 domain-containing protein [Methylococcales bacterium]|nr:MASE1 domain-containing protein [Methylococcales bacterium]